MDKISLIIPCYNEHESLPYLKKELDKLIKKMNKVEFELIFIDNCSEDNTLEIIKDYAKKDKTIKYISFSKNFGKDASMFAGLKNSTGDYVAIMDADLQDPPELIESMYEILKNEDYDCVAPFRKDRKGDPLLASFFSKAFYKFYNKIASIKMKGGARDFRLMTRQMVNSILTVNERVRFTKGIFLWVGYKTKWISFPSQKRVAGKTKLPFKSAFKYAMQGIISYSTLPVRLSFIFSLMLSISFVIYTIINFLVLHNPFNFQYVIISLLLLLFMMLFIILGILGEYLYVIFQEIKNRPMYIIKDSSKNMI